MNKSIIKKQAEERLQQLKDLLLVTDIAAPATHEEVKKIQHLLQEAERIITVYEYLLAQNEIASDINVHLKIMELSDQKEKKEEIKATIQQDVIPVVPKEEKKTEQEPKQKEEVKNATPEKEIPVETKTVKSPAPSTKKIEMGINDKYRIINDLFDHNQQEFTIALEQLNSLESWALTKQYLDSLTALYSWDPEKDIVKTLYRISQKRFS